MSKETANKIVDKMLAEDKFSEWLGIEKILVEEGHCILKMKIRDEMVNGFGISHGGIAFSFADSALAFASNAYGRLSVALECSISFAIAVKVGDELTCEAKELSLTNKTATYHIEIVNQKNEKVAFFKGTVYRTSKNWELDGTDIKSLQIYESKEVDSDKNINQPISSHKEAKKSNLSSEENFVYPDLSYQIIGCAYEVYNQLGAGHKESIYQNAMMKTFEKHNIANKKEIYYSVKLDGQTIGKNYLDFLVDDKIIVELKSLARFSKAHFDQVLNYLKVTNLKLALLINFSNTQVMIKRVINFNSNL